MAFPMIADRRLGDHLLYMGQRAHRIHEEDAIARAREVVPVEQLWQRAREEMEYNNSFMWLGGEKAGGATLCGKDAGGAKLCGKDAGDATLSAGTPSTSGPRKAFSSPCAMFFEEALTRVLLAWFKDDFFSKFNKRTCPLCERQAREVGCDLRHPPRLFSAMDTFAETDLEIRGQARRIEIFTCEKCEQEIRFPRLSDPVVLLETRTGEQNEWILAFMLCCVAVGLDVREVTSLDTTYWAEVWWPEPAGKGAREADEALPSPARGRWVHVDPFEGEMDRPGRHRGKALFIDSYVAVGWGSCSDVMPRYSSRCRSAARTVRTGLQVRPTLRLHFRCCDCDDDEDEDHEDSFYLEEEGLPAPSEADDGVDDIFEQCVMPPSDAERFWDKLYWSELRQFGDLQRQVMFRALTDATAKAAQADQRTSFLALPRELTALPTSPKERVAFEEARERSEAAQMAMRVYGGFSSRSRGDLCVRFLNGDESAVLDGAKGARWPRIALVHARPFVPFQRVVTPPPAASSSSSSPLVESPFPGTTLLQGGVCRASDDNPPWETAFAAFDGSASTKWLCFGGQEGHAWLERRIERRGPRARPPVRLVGIALTSANDFPERDPAAVEVQAMDASGRWVCVAEILDLAFSERHEKITRELPSPSFASWAFRLMICSVQDPQSADCVQLEAWDLYVADA